MQSVSQAFTERTTAPMRHLDWRLLASFLKVFDDDIDFFTIGVSTIGGTDIIKGVGSVVQEWDKYDYEDFSNRVLSFEYVRETEPPIGAVTLAMADIVFDNHDDLFTPTNRSGRYYGNIANGRPIRLYVGFKDTEKIQVFVGLTEGMPDIDEKNKTARFHCIDFLRKLQNTELTETVMFTDDRTDEVISGVLQSAGLATSQFSLDVGSVVIPFAYFPKGTKVGKAIREITEAELGAVYMDENGIIRFENRTNWNSKSQSWQFTKSNVIDISSPDVSKIINSVEVFSKARGVEAKQKLWENNGAVSFTDNTKVLNVGQSKDVFIDFKDDYGDLPVTSADTPVYITSATTSLFATNTAEDGSEEAVTGVTVGVSLFSTAMKITFTNSGVRSCFLTQLEVWGTPAKVQNDIYELVQDASSIAEFEEQTYKIENNYIQDSTAAKSIASIIIDDRGEILDQRTFIIKGVPQLQTGDFVRFVDETGDNDTYFVTKVGGILSLDGFKQTINVSKRTINSYFRIGISTIGGTDVIAP